MLTYIFKLPDITEEKPKSLLTATLADLDFFDSYFSRSEKQKPDAALDQTPRTQLHSPLPSRAARLRGHRVTAREGARASQCPTAAQPPQNGRTQLSKGAPAQPGCSPEVTQKHLGTRRAELQAETIDHKAIKALQRRAPPRGHAAGLCRAPGTSSISPATLSSAPGWARPARRG